MASTWSALKIELLETGQNSGTWGTSTNVNLGDAVLGEAITGQATVDFATDADVTITLTDSATTQAARNLRLNITESSTGIGSVRNLILGSGCQIEKFYLINNTGTGAKTVKNTSGTGISVPAGKATLVFNNGTNVVDAASYFSSLTLGSALPVASGGTGVTTSTGTTNVVLSNSPTLVTPVLGVATATSLQGIIGNVTPAAGSFTTVDASGSVTLSGGTANGVTYLNGSKVLTSGSALVFDGTNLGIGVTPSAWLSSIRALQVNNAGMSLFTYSASASVDQYAFLTNNSYQNSSVQDIYVRTNPAAQYRLYNGTHAWFNAPSGTAGNAISFTQAMTLTATGRLGIGTTTPSSTLDARGDANLGTNLYLGESAVFQEQRLTVVGSTSGSTGLSFSGWTGAAYTERARIDSSGNFTVGDTVSSGRITGTKAGKGSFSGIDTTASAAGVGGTLDLGGNYRTTGDYQPFVRVSAEKANAINADYGYNMAFFTTTNGGSSMANRVMTLDSVGNVGIGTASPTNRVSIVTASGSDGIVSVKSPTTETAGVLIDGGSTSNKGALLTLAKDATTKWRIGLDSAIGGGTNNNLNILGSSTDALLFGTNAAERMRITSAGEVGIGASSPEANAKLTVYGAGIAVSRTADTVTPSGFDFKCRSSNPKIGLHVTNTGQTATLEFGTANDNSLGALINVTGADPLRFGTNNTERGRFDSSGRLLVGTTSLNFGLKGSALYPSGLIEATVDANICMNINRLTDDGTLFGFYQASILEGSISVSGTTVSYNGGHLSRYAQTTTAKDNSLVKGTVLSNLDEMNVYTKDGQPVDNEQLNKVKVSDTEGDVNVAGVFVNWSHDDAHNVDEINMAMTGDMIIRIAQGVTVVRGDLLMSAGDGTAKPQGDDIVRSKTVAKVTSNHVTCTYADGSYCVPCVLMAC